MSDFTKKRKIENDMQHISESSDTKITMEDIKEMARKIGDAIRKMREIKVPDNATEKIDIDAILREEIGNDFPVPSEERVTYSARDFMPKKKGTQGSKVVGNVVGARGFNKVGNVVGANVGLKLKL